jgi:hypothetical protein
MRVPRPHQLPVTVVLGAIIVGIIAASTAGLDVSRVALTWPVLAAGDVWRIPVSPLVQEDPADWSILLLLPCLALAEHRFGSPAALLLFFGVDALSTLPVLTALHLAGVAGWREARELADEPNMGSSAGLIGALGAWIAALAPRTRWRWALGLAGALAVGMAVQPGLAGVQHVIAAIVGAAVGVALTRRMSRTAVA